MSTPLMHNDDLVTLAEAERELGVTPRLVRQIEQRTREGAVTGMPSPLVVGRSVRLWSLGELRGWWQDRQEGGDGRALRHTR